MEVARFWVQGGVFGQLGRFFVEGGPNDAGEERGAGAVFSVGALQAVVARVRLSRVALVREVDHAAKRSCVSKEWQWLWYVDLPFAFFASLGGRRSACSVLPGHPVVVGYYFRVVEAYRRLVSFKGSRVFNAASVPVDVWAVWYVAANDLVGYEREVVGEDVASFGYGLKWADCICRWTYE